jgi:hypothetical protein
LPAIFPVDPKTHRHWGFLGQEEQLPQVVQVELAIGIGKRYPTETCRLEPGTQRGSVPSISLMADQPHARPLPDFECDSIGGGVAAAVVNDDDLILPD